ncbi:hypothetical protein SAMN04488038_104252 [Solimonas aquatica]|uniref:Uncharacterized protein n=1 Tax=Solimonas aquatica TaxID=489703 RepID=A0A1H9E3B9_9GAMM|nr:hypothetical protein [Solimonas aquatica]SEQ19733.1 hypothetical protein SAMN04488038_104252 [Solimonas aquatica]
MSPKNSRAPLWPRWLLAGPLAALCAALIMAGGALWLPRGAAGIDNLVLPILAFPAIWAVLFFYACLTRHLRRAYALLLALLLAHALALGLQLS